MKRITLAEALPLIKEGAPNGLFFQKKGDVWVAINKSEFELLARSSGNDPTREAS